MSWPGLTDYQDALQHPQIAFTIRELKEGSVATDAHGMPSPLSGAMVFTFTVTSSGHTKYAVRCFQREMPDLAGRYQKIANGIGQLRSDSAYFVDFRFHIEGLNIKGKRYPCLQMQWVEGLTLGSFLNTYHANSTAITHLQLRFRKMASNLTEKGVAHGDIQNLNIMVTPTAELKLIDYDGMFVPGMREGYGNETGLKYFQHPARSTKHFGPKMDRFSFITVDLSLSALKEDPSLYPRYREGGETIIFKANDFADPSSSPVFRYLAQRPTLRQAATRFAAICQSSYDAVPTLEDFLAGRNVPAAEVLRIGDRQRAPERRPSYIAAYPVLDGTSFLDAIAKFGQRVELIGQIRRTRQGKTKHGKPFMFLHFDQQAKDGVRIILWSEALEQLRHERNTNWEGKWISCTGLLADRFPRARSGRYKYIYIGIVIETPSQLSIIDEAEARYRLRQDTVTATDHTAAVSLVRNIDKLKPIVVASTSSSASQVRVKSTVRLSSPLPPQPLTENQRRLLQAGIVAQPQPTSSRTMVSSQFPAQTYQHQRSWLSRIWRALTGSLRGQ
jgi:hypothetical protein